MKKKRCDKPAIVLEDQETRGGDKKHVAMAIPLSGKKGKYAQRNEQWRDASQHITGTGLLK